MSAPKVFLSYAHSESDREFVKSLYERLEQGGISCFFDEKSLEPGANFILKISEAIDECNYLVMVMSPAYFSAGFASTEWGAVLSTDPKNERGRLIPLLREECEIPALLSQLSYTDMTSPEKIDTNYPRILQFLCQLSPNDIEQRLSELDELIDQQKIEQLIKRILDFAHDFFIKDKSTINRLIAIKMEIGDIGQSNEEITRADRKTRTDLLTEGLNIKDSIVERLSFEAG